MKEISTVTELQAIILEIQKKVHAFCVKHAIPYSLSGGTCIGAIRHKGFIPWDDDIDLFLIRENYERFLDIFKQDPIPGLRVATFEGRKRYFLPFAKVEDVRTRVDELTNHPAEVGVNIDLFPLSGLPNGDFAQKGYLVWCRLLRNMLALKQVKPVAKRSWEKNLVLYLGRILLCWLPLKSLLRMMDWTSKMFAYEKADYVCEIFSGVTKPFPKSAMENVVLLPFEDASFFVMSGYDAYLRATYKNYMQLPPEEQRVTHHAFEAYWTD